MSQSGIIEIMQKGEVIEKDRLSLLRGPIRLRLARKDDEAVCK
jgi:hypothetical protein